jgi:hypothetical protein
MGLGRTSEIDNAAPREGDEVSRATGGFCLLAESYVAERRHQSATHRPVNTGVVNRDDTTETNR